MANNDRQAALDNALKKIEKNFGKDLSEFRIDEEENNIEEPNKEEIEL